MAKHGSLDLLLLELSGPPSHICKYNEYQVIPEIGRAIEQLKDVHGCEATARTHRGQQIIRVRVDPVKRKTSADIRTKVMQILRGFAIDPRYFDGEATIQ